MQNKRSLLWVGAALMLMATGTVLTSCKKSFEEPPATGPANIVANTSIKDLKARYTLQGTTVEVTDSVVISGVVNMDDKSGNYYQQISIQDETGGILLRLAGSNLNTSYPVGRRVYVKCKGLVLGDYGRMIQLGGGVDTANGGVTLLTANLQDQHIIKGELNQPLVPKTVTFGQLGTSLQDPYVNTLIRLADVQFATGDTSKNYADATGSGNRFVQSCTNPTTNRVTLRTSNFANFATQPIPNGYGSINGIYSLFNTTKQLTIRDTADVQMTAPYCTTTTGGGTGGTNAGSTITLGTSPYLIDFNGLGTSLPAGVYAYTAATASDSGTVATFTATPALWGGTSAGFKNFASATGLTSASGQTEQDGSTNRALGVRQTSSTGYDPGATFAFKLENTTGKNNLKLDFQLQSLDAASGRVTTWIVDYALGNQPTAFTTVAATGTMTTGGNTWSNNAVSVTLPAAVNNQSQRVWIRITARTATTGGGNRASTAIDDVKFTWN